VPCINTHSCVRHLSPLMSSCRPPRRVLQQLRVDVCSRQLDVPHDAASYEAVVDGDEVGMLVGVRDLHVVELDVEVLVDGVQRTTQRQIVLQLHHYGLTHQRLEKVKELLEEIREGGRNGEGGESGGEGKECTAERWDGWSVGATMSEKKLGRKVMSVDRCETAGQ
jgi:hypothetical protein